jgi:hypothetical protein
MDDKRVTSVIQTYERHQNSKPYVCSTMFGRAKLGANGIPNKLIHAFLFRDPDVGVQFLKDLELTRRRMVCCRCGSHISWCVDTNRKDGYRWWCRRVTPASVCPASTSIGTVHGFSREFHEGFVLHVRHRSFTRTRSWARGGTWRHSSFPTTWWGTTCQLAHYMFAAGSRSDNVDQFTKFIGIVATMDYSAIPPHLLGHAATKLAVAPLQSQCSRHPKHVRSCRAHHHGWCGTVIRGALRATRL